MYVRTSEGLDRGPIPYTGGLSSSYIGEPQPSVKTECSGYEKGEKEISWCQQGACRQGHLPADVIAHPRGLLIADFGVGSSDIKESTKKEKLLRDWLGKAKSALHSIVLRIYGYSDCIGEGRKNEDLRSKRAKQVYELLDKDLQSRVVFFGPARAGEYIADNKTRKGRAKNRGVIIELLRIPEERPPCSGPSCKPPPPPPCFGPRCKPPPPPQKLPQNPQQRDWKVVGKYSWKGKRRRLAKRGYFEIYGEPEVEATISVNATDTEFATFAAKLQKGKGLSGQFETKFSEWFVPNLKIERGKDGWKISFKKGFKLLGERVVLTPNLQLSTEVVKTEVDLLPFTIPVTLFGQEVKMGIKPRVNIIIKIDLGQVLVDRLKKRLRDWLADLLKDLLASLGRGVLGSLAGKVLAGLLGGVLAHLFISDPPTTPVTAPPDDVNGKDRALTQAGGITSAAQILQTWANTHRHAFAKAFADTMLELSRDKWTDRLAGLRSLSLKSYKDLPALNAPDREWVVWASTRKALQIISIDLPTDDFAKRFRWYELMLMFAIAAWILRRMTKDEVDQVKAVALQQASAAGIAAAVQYVNRRIAADTFEFIDELGKTQKSSGIKRWDTIGALVRSSQLSDAEISKRLEQLGIKQLPGLPKTA